MFSVGMAVFLPLMVAGNHVLIFNICYLLGGICFVIISTASAVHSTEVVGERDIGTFTSTRLIFMTLG